LRKETKSQKIKREIIETLDLLRGGDKWERREIPDNFCSHCDHKEKHHKSCICQKCWWNKQNDNTKIIPCHEFNKEPERLLMELQNMLPRGKFMKDDYRVYLAIRSASAEELKEIESAFNWKLKSIEPNGNELWIIFSTAHIFCRYCRSPFLTIEERTKHETGYFLSGDLPNCHERPPEVTFATGV